MSIKEMKQYKRDALFGALGAFLMLIGDLRLSVIPDKPKRQRIICKRGVSERLMGAMETSAADCNRSFRHGACFFTVRVSYRQIEPQYRKTRMAVLIGGVIYIATAGALHLFIGSLADWTTTLSPLLGREETITLIQNYYNRIMPAMYFAYAGIILLILISAFAVLTKKTVLPRHWED